MPELPRNSGGGGGLANRLDEISAQSAVAFSPCMLCRATSSEISGPGGCVGLYEGGVRVIGLGSRWVADKVSSRPITQ